MVRTLAAAIALAVLASSSIHGQPARAGQSGRQTGKPAVGTPININTASTADLQKLPGIGARTAGRIVEYRQKNGPFKKIEDLMNVQGIGEKNFLKLRSQISVGAPKAEAANPQ